MKQGWFILLLCVGCLGSGTVLAVDEVNNMGKDVGGKVSFQEAQSIAKQKAEQYLRNLAPIKKIQDEKLRGFVSKLKVYIDGNSNPTDNLASFYKGIETIAVAGGVLVRDDLNPRSDADIVQGINNYFGKYNLLLSISTIGEEGGFRSSIRVAHVKSVESKTVLVPLLNKEVAFDEIVLNQLYIDTDPSGVAFVKAEEGHAAKPTIFCKRDSLARMSANIFFDEFDSYRRKGVNISEKEVLSDADLREADGDQAMTQLNLVPRLDRKWMYRAWRELYLDAISKYKDEEQQVSYFTDKFIDIKIPSFIDHEATHLVDNLKPPLSDQQALMAEFKAFTNQLISSPVPFVELSSLIGIVHKGIEDMGDNNTARPSPHSLAASTLLTFLANSYCEFMNRPKPVLNENNALDAFSYLDGIDRLSNDDLKKVIRMMKEGAFPMKAENGAVGDEKGTEEKFSTPDELYSKGINFLKIGEFAKALEAFLAADKLQPGEANIYNALGMAYQKTGNNIQALQYFQKALGIKPDSSEYLVNIAFYYYDLGKCDLALPYFKKALSLNSEMNGLSRYIDECSKR